MPRFQQSLGTSKTCVRCRRGKSSGLRPCQMPAKGWDELNCVCSVPFLGATLILEEIRHPSRDFFGPTSPRERRPLGEKQARNVSNLIPYALAVDGWTSCKMRSLPALADLPVSPRRTTPGLRPTSPARRSSIKRLHLSACEPSGCILRARQSRFCTKPRSVKYLTANSALASSPSLMFPHRKHLLLARCRKRKPLLLSKVCQNPFPAGNSGSFRRHESSETNREGAAAGLGFVGSQTNISLSS